MFCQFTMIYCLIPRQYQLSPAVPTHVDNPIMQTSFIHILPQITCNYIGTLHVTYLSRCISYLHKLYVIYCKSNQNLFFIFSIQIRCISFYVTHLWKYEGKVLHNKYYNKSADTDFIWFMWHNICRYIHILPQITCNYIGTLHVTYLSRCISYLHKLYVIYCKSNQNLFFIFSIQIRCISFYVTHLWKYEGKVLHNKYYNKSADTDFIWFMWHNICRYYLKLPHGHKHKLHVRIWIYFLRNGLDVRRFSSRFTYILYNAHIWRGFST